LASITIAHFPSASNDRGQVVGFSNTESGGFRAFLWDDRTMIDLGALPGSNPESVATAINQRGRVVGYAETASGQRHAVLWTRLPRSEPNQ